MGRPRGGSNRVRWDPPQMLNLLSSSLTRTEVVSAFKQLDLEAQIGVLIKLDEAASGVPEPRLEGVGRGGQ